MRWRALLLALSIGSGCRSAGGARDAGQAPPARASDPWAALHRKIDLLLKVFPSQAGKHWFSRELFMSMLRIRGMEGNVPTLHAEAFYCRKAVLAMEGG